LTSPNVTINGHPELDSGSKIKIAIEQRC
jgi:hypothetical protein